MPETDIAQVRKVQNPRTRRSFLHSFYDNARERITDIPIAKLERGIECLLANGFTNHAQIIGEHPSYRERCSLRGRFQTELGVLATDTESTVTAGFELAESFAIRVPTWYAGGSVLATLIDHYGRRDQGFQFFPLDQDSCSMITFGPNGQTAVYGRIERPDTLYLSAAFRSWENPPKPEPTSGRHLVGEQEIIAGWDVTPEVHYDGTGVARKVREFYLSNDARVHVDCDLRPNGKILETCGDPDLPGQGFIDRSKLEERGSANPHLLQILSILGREEPEVTAHVLEKGLSVWHVYPFLN